MGQNLALSRTQERLFINWIDTFRERERYSTSVKSLFDNYIKNNQQKDIRL